MKAKRFWVSLVVGLLLLSLVIQGAALVLAVSDASFAVDPDYEGQAARVDDAARQRLVNAALGWNVRVGVSPAPSLREALVEATVTDAAQRPIDGATVHVRMLHVARAANVLAANLSPRGDGRYAGVSPIRRDGIWEFQVEVEKDGQRFTDTVRQNLALRPRPME
jgi:nitrogen fixation protein FixH